MFAMSRHDDLATCRRRFLDEPSKLFLKLTSNAILDGFGSKYRMTFC